MARVAHVSGRPSQGKRRPSRARAKKVECPGVVVSHCDGRSSCIVCLIDQRSVAKATHKSREECRGCVECASERFNTWGKSRTARGLKRWLPGVWNSR
jgi:hypothetical protein